METKKSKTISLDQLKTSHAWKCAMQNIYRVHGDLPGKCKLEFEGRTMMDWMEDEIVHESNIEMLLD